MTPEYVWARREIIRANHPDRGGSDEQLITALRDSTTSGNAASVCDATLKASGSRASSPRTSPARPPTSNTLYFLFFVQLSYC